MSKRSELFVWSLEFAPPSMDEHAFIEPVALPNPSQRLPRSWSVGTDPQCEIRLPHPTVSRYHGTFFMNEDYQLTFQDRSSTNGTYLIRGNRRQLLPTQHPMSLSPGDCLVLGKVVVHLRLGQQSRILHTNELLDQGREPRETIWVFFQDPGISDVFINDYNRGYYLKGSSLYPIQEGPFSSQGAYRRWIEELVAICGERLDEAHPLLETKTPWGIRVQISAPPIASGTYYVSLRALRKTPPPLEPHELSLSVVDPRGPEDRPNQDLRNIDGPSILKRLVQNRENLVISGATGAGKSTLLARLSHYFQPHERIIVLEDREELNIPHSHTIYLRSYTSRSTLLSEGSLLTTPSLDYNLPALLKTSLRMRPDRLILGECRGEEATTFLTALNTGHGGSMTTIHANGPYEALRRLETLVLLQHRHLDPTTVAGWVQQAIDNVLHIRRVSIETDGSRKIDAELLPLRYKNSFH